MTDNENSNAIPIPNEQPVDLVQDDPQKDKFCDVREIKTYQADDGRKVQILSKVDSVKVNGSLAANFDINKEDIFVGSCLFNHPAVGPQQIIFEIKEVKNYLEAFDQFDKFAEPAIKEAAENINKQIQEKMKQNPPQPQIATPNKIITARR